MKLCHKKIRPWKTNKESNFRRWSQTFIDSIFFMNSLFNLTSFHSTFLPKVVEILIELINKSYRNQKLPKLQRTYQ